MGSVRKAERAMVTVSCAKSLGMERGLLVKNMRPLPSLAMSSNSLASGSVLVPSPMTETVAPARSISLRSFL